MRYLPGTHNGRGVAMTRRILVGFLIVLGLAVPASSQVELSEEARRANFDRLVANMWFEHSPDYRITPGDNLFVTVSGFGSNVMVDGYGNIRPSWITLPPGSFMITDPYTIQAAGLTPWQLRSLIAERITDPTVSVSVTPYRRNVCP